MVRQKASFPQLAERPADRPSRDAGASRNPFVFIVGCPRSGTTLLTRMVNAHPDVAMTSRESHWIARCFNKRIGVTAEGMITSSLISWLLEDERFASLEIGREDLERVAATGPVSYASFVAAIFDLYGERQGKRLVGDKTPGYVRVLPTLHALWPQTKFVHLIRDGRDVCLSVLDWNKSDRILSRFGTWTEDPVSTVALWWSWSIRLGQLTGATMGGDLYHELRYESLVAQPADECVRLCRFLGVRPDTAILDFHRGRLRTDPGLDAKHGWLPVTPGLRDWRSQMSAENVARFEAAAGDLLKELGYERRFPRPSLEHVEAASRIRRGFIANLNSRRLPLPEGW